MTENQELIQAANKIATKRKVGRPTKYAGDQTCKQVDQYLKENQDSYNEGKLEVKLPTLEGFAAHIGVHKETIQEWKRRHPEFSVSLGKILAEQKTRLINMGLAGDYNPTIAKLILSANHGMSDKVDASETGGITINLVGLDAEV